jgi:hypothetical protein
VKPDPDPDAAAAAAGLPAGGEEQLPAAAQQVIAALQARVRALEQELAAARATRVNPTAVRVAPGVCLCACCPAQMITQGLRWGIRYTLQLTDICFRQQHTQ